ncbi:MAG TPA: hypothetical protein VGS22_02855 [Thermoanaerobaculia bacterium]|jgi:transcriptional regulator with XRE-family HTH domain|nr:hypothetical protein [Thermoanaerobaculia bacterium]
MSDKDTKAVLEIVRRAVAAAPGTKHEVEQAMEIGHGRLDEIFNGQMELRVRHVNGLARYLKVPTSDFFRLALVEAERSLPHRLEDWIVHNPDPPSKRRAAAKEPDADLKEGLREMIREEIAAALAKKKG